MSGSCYGSGDTLEGLLGTAWLLMVTIGYYWLLLVTVGREAMMTYFIKTLYSPFSERRS